jgi:hypothetical protein
MRRQSMFFVVFWARAGGRMARERRARAALAAALSIILKLRRPLRYGGAGALGGRTGQFMNSCPSAAPRPARLPASPRRPRKARMCAPQAARPPAIARL